eukprot:COSAG04_NODE_275_length_18463_cov_71.053746_1_plen_185_part_00
MAIGSTAIQATQGKIDDDNARIQRHAEKKERELKAQMEAKAAKRERDRNEMVAGLNAQMQAQEERRLKEIADQKRVAVQYAEEAETYARQDAEKAARLLKKNESNAATLKEQIARRALEGTVIDKSMGWVRTMDRREETMNRCRRPPPPLPSKFQSSGVSANPTHVLHARCVCSFLDMLLIVEW